MLQSLVKSIFAVSLIGLFGLTQAGITGAGHVKCVKDCHGVKNGDYQDCSSCYVYVTCSNNQITIRPCPVALEWDDKSKSCVAQSSTCKTIVGNLARFQFNAEPVEITMSQAQGPSQSERNVPADQVERQPENLGAEEEIRRVNIPRPRHCNSTGTNCVSDCTGMKDGDYQSCHGCDVYVSCVAGYRYDDRPCAPGGLVWDDNKKRCEWTSPTCKGCYTPDKPCSGTGPCCVRDCSKLPDGDYQSCLGCAVYLSCSNGLKYDRRPCAPGGTVWDDNKKICDWYSNTCFKC